LLSTDDRGRTYEIAIAPDTPLSFNIAGKHVLLTDERGVKVERTGSLLNVQHRAAAAVPLTLTFVISGRTDQ
jgi:hypothetical protein